MGKDLGPLPEDSAANRGSRIRRSKAASALSDFLYRSPEWLQLTAIEELTVLQEELRARTGWLLKDEINGQGE